MTKDEFKQEFKRLCDGFSYQPRQLQVDAFYERLSHCHCQDWREAVTDLLCAAKFPMNLNLILDAVERRAEQRRRAAVINDQPHAQRTLVSLAGCVSMREALAEKPELLKAMAHLLTPEASSGESA